MHRIDGQYHAANLFVDGNPTSTPPVYPTWFTAKWCNAVQEEMCNLLEAVGVTLSDSNHGQVMQIINQSYAVFDLYNTNPPTEVELLNVASVTRIGVGHYRVAWDTDFANGDYCVSLGVGWSDSTTTTVFVQTHTPAAGSIDILVRNSSFTLIDTANIRVSVRASGEIVV